MQELSKYAPEREWRLIEVNASLQDIDVHRQHLIGEHFCSFLHGIKILVRAAQVARHLQCLKEMDCTST